MKVFELTHCFVDYFLLQHLRRFNQGPYALNMVFISFCSIFISHLESYVYIKKICYLSEYVISNAAINIYQQMIMCFDVRDQTYKR